MTEFSCWAKPDVHEGMKARLRRRWNRLRAFVPLKRCKCNYYWHIVTSYWCTFLEDGPDILSSQRCRLLSLVLRALFLARCVYTKLHVRLFERPTFVFAVCVVDFVSRCVLECARRVLMCSRLLFTRAYAPCIGFFHFLAITDQPADRKFAQFVVAPARLQRTPFGV